MSYSRAMAAGAKQRLRVMSQPAVVTTVRRRDRCHYTGCGSPATFQSGRLRVCRFHKQGLES